MKTSGASGKPKLKVTARVRAEWTDLRKTMSDYEIAERYGCSEGTIRYHLGPREGARGDAAVTAEGATEPLAVTEPSPAPPPVPLDETPLAIEKIAGTLSGLVRQQSAEAQRLMAEGDHAGARSVVRLLSQMARDINKMHARDEADGDMTKVRTADLLAAGERGRAKLQDLVARLVEARNAGAGT